jgi:predicted transcriptional regulator of viral defense system
MQWGSLLVHTLPPNRWVGAAPQAQRGLWPTAKRVAHKQYFFGTVCTVPGKYWNTIMDVAIEHGGYITPTLMAATGVPAIELRKMVSRGTLDAAGHGIYRVPALPLDRYDEFILAGLWTRQHGVISHDSALAFHELCDINPTLIHLTIPISYRITRAGGSLYALHRNDLTSSDVTEIEAVTVTSIRRTLDDSVNELPTYLVRQAITTARQRGAITAAEATRFVRRTHLSTPR